jgi:hypothetical protein
LELALPAFFAATFVSFVFLPGIGFVPMAR